MDDDVAEIDQYPFATILAFHRQDLAPGFAHLVVDIARQRLDLAVGIAGGDDNAVEHRGQFGGVDDFDILAFDVFKGGYDDFLQLAEFHHGLL